MMFFRRALQRSVSGLSRLFVIRFDFALQLDRQRIAFAIDLVAHGHLDPAFADAVLLHVVAFLVVEADTHVMFKNGGDVVRAALIG